MKTYVKAEVQLHGYSKPKIDGEKSPPSHPGIDISGETPSNPLWSGEN
jgi:hypothetical protein